MAVQRLREPESTPSLDEEQLKQAVLAGVSQANTALGTSYHVDIIQYVPTDTPHLEVYAFLARSLIEQFVQFELQTPQFEAEGASGCSISAALGSSRP